MSVAVAVVPASPESVTSTCRVTVTDADQNDIGAYDSNVYPSSPAVTYYLAFLEGSELKGKSYSFQVDENGDHEFNSYTFPDAGTWTVQLRKEADDTVVASASVTVS